MKCKQIRNLLITDYFDGETGRHETCEVESHLEICSGCREYIETLRQTARVPFLEAGRQNPPERVWHNIESAIRLQKKPARISLGEWLDRFIPVLSLKRLPALAFAAAILAWAVIIPRFQNPAVHYPLAENYLTETLEAFTDENQPYNHSGRDGFGSVIEDYFM